MDRIKVVLISGFLGAGKTTVLRNLLPELTEKKQKIAILVNDFGKVAVDGALLDGYQIPVCEISGGSIFCVCKQAGLIESLSSIAEEIAPELLLIEASGLSEPTDVSALLQNTFLQNAYSLPQTITVVDALNYSKLSGILRVLPMQIKIADSIIVSKTDLATEEQLKVLEEELGSLNQHARIIHADKEKIYGNAVLTDYSGIIDKDSSMQLCKDATPGFKRFDFCPGRTINRKAFESLLAEFGSDILRAKGVVDFENGPEFVDMVNGEYSMSSVIPSGLQEGSRHSVFFALKENVGMRFSMKINDL